MGSLKGANRITLLQGLKFAAEFSFSFFPNTFLLILFCDLTRSLYSSELIALTSSEEHWGGGQAACHLSHEISTSMETPISLLVKLCTPLGRIFSWSVWGGLLSAGTAPWILLREE